MSTETTVTREQGAARAQTLPEADRLRLTEAAAAHISALMKNEPTALGLRVGVKKSGCSGFAYVMDFAKDIQPEDYAFDCDGLFLICDAESYPILRGSTLDYVVNGLSRLLQFQNPNVVDSCGCGESFTIMETSPVHV
ncbi:MAG: iron-sulfur cluster assembly accessory protein [Halothiobacillus sp.]|jgi:iron-sulfur cluster assembly protein|nr:iron-sulfur cluster assembly accessory protein [Halothiobacillus sp.]